MLRKIALTLAALVVGTSGLAMATAGSASANPGSPKCMTKAEWRKIHDGQSRAQVKRIVGNNGKITSSSEYSDGTRDVSVSYRQCKPGSNRPASSWDTVWISFSTEVTYGQWVWDDCASFSADYDCVGGQTWDDWTPTGVTYIPRVDYKGAWFQ